MGSCDDHSIDHVLSERQNNPESHWCIYLLDSLSYNDSDSGKCLCRQEHFIGRRPDTISAVSWCHSWALMAPDKPLINRHNFMLVWGGRGSSTFLLDEALTKQKVMTCEVVLTIAVAWLPNRAACWHSCGSIQRVLQSWRWQRHILLTCLFLCFSKPH